MSKDTAEVGFAGSHCMAEAPKAVSIRGAVSPITRDIANKMPVKMPPKAEGMRTFNTIMVYDEPREREASLRLSGRRLRVSSVERMIRGNNMIANDMEPAIAE